MMITNNIQNEIIENKLINISDLSKFNIDYFVYTDCACKNNQTDDALSGIGIYFGENDVRNISKKVIGKQSNNVAELQAIIDVYEIVKNDINDKKICIVSDSTYALRCITDYGEIQCKNNWRKNIPNKDLVKYGYELYENEKNIYFMHVKAHTDNIHSKEINCANKLANVAIRKKEENKLVNDRLITIFDVFKFNIDYFVYTDGACLNNGFDNAVAGIGIYFKEDDVRNVSKKVIGKQSNNVAELQAIIDVYEIIKNDINDKKICIVSDSIYALRCITDYGEKQCENNWKKDIPNKDLIKYGYELYKNEKNIYFIHIRAHTNNTDIHSKGNECADKLANNAIGMEECPYNASVKNISNKIYLKVSFSKKEIKKLGGIWDSEEEKWYIFNDNIHKDYILKKFN
jgi:ribonuclease HI